MAGLAKLLLLSL